MARLVIDVDDAAISGLTYKLEVYNRKAGVTLDLTQFMAMLLNSWARHAEGKRNRDTTNAIVDAVRTLSEEERVDMMAKLPESVKDRILGSSRSKQRGTVSNDRGEGILQLEVPANHRNSKTTN